MKHFSRTLVFMSVNPRHGFCKFGDALLEKGKEMRKISNLLVSNKVIDVEPWPNDEGSENCRNEANIRNVPKKDGNF